MKLTQIHHIAFIVSNYEVSKDFYVNKLGFDIIRENYREDRNDYKLDLRCGDVELEIFGQVNPPKKPERETCGLRHLAFKVDHIESIIEELESKGIEVEPLRYDTFTHKKMTFFKDPDGQPLELHE